MPVWKVHASRHSKEYYLKARARLGKETSPAKLGALLIYLNKTCYNGLYRVNKAGEFNVPLGSYTDPTILDEGNLRAASLALQDAEIKQHGFEQARVNKITFYYLDPPYHKVYDGYAAGRFGDEDHGRLSSFCKEIDKAGSLFMLLQFGYSPSSALSTNPSILRQWPLPVRFPAKVPSAAKRQSLSSETTALIYLTNHADRDTLSIIISALQRENLWLTHGKSVAYSGVEP